MILGQSYGADPGLGPAVILILIVLAVGVPVLILRWVLRIDYRVRQLQQIIETLERIEDRLQTPDDK